MLAIKTTSEKLMYYSFNPVFSHGGREGMFEHHVIFRTQ